MIIGIDGNEANVKNRVGVGEYAFELLSQFSSSKFKVQSSKFLIYLKSKPVADMPQENEFLQYKVFGPKPFWTQFALPVRLHLERPRPDVFFTPTHYGPRFCPVPLVISVMDLSYIHFPQLFRKTDLYKLQNWTKYSVQKAKRALTISNASKDDILREYRIDEKDVVVTYPGIKMEVQSSSIRGAQDKVQSFDEVKRKYGLESNYILFVGTLQPRKNIVLLIEAFALTLKNAKQDAEPRGKESLQLLIVGQKGWMYEEILQAPKHFGVEKSVRFLNFVSDEDLAVLYQNAQFFILPSLYEGFGLPVLEAMKHGCPVITSNVSSLPEAGGAAALYVDPMDPSDIAEKMKKLLIDKSLRKELIEKGKKQVAKFSWEKTARETLQVLEKVVEENR